MPYLYRITGSTEFIKDISYTELKRLFDIFSGCVCDNKQKEIKILKGILKNGVTGSEKNRYLKRILWLLKKFAFRKYKDIFLKELAELKKFAAGFKDRYPALTQNLNGIESIAEKRLNG